MLPVTHVAHTLRIVRNSHGLDVYVWGDDGEQICLGSRMLTLPLLFIGRASYEAWVGYWTKLIPPPQPDEDRA